jgi:nicotinate-nucleotide adenylyltransferase
LLGACRGPALTRPYAPSPCSTRRTLVADPARSPLRLGVFGGTFDPPHVGHLVTAVNVRHELQLDLVLLEVANRPWQKEGARPISPAEERFALVRAAVGPVEGLEASRIEIDRGGPSYTADTLVELRRRHPGAELFTILGSDAAGGIKTWERFDAVLALSRLVVVARPGAELVVPPGIEWIQVVVPYLEVSSTDLRERVRDGRPLDYLVPEGVLAEIERRGLYLSAMHSR